MKRCMLCHWLLQRRRFLLVIPYALVTLLTPFFAPVWVFLLLLSILLTLGAMCAIYLRDLPQVWSPDMLRAPSPRDGQAEMVMVDAALVDHGPALLQVAQPATPVSRLTPLPDEGARLLGTAMCLLSDSLPRPDAAALTRAAQDQLGLKAADLLLAHPVLSDGEEDGMLYVTCREEDGERTWFTGPVDVVLAASAAIFEGDDHLLGAQDRSRILAAAQAMSASGEHLHAFATARGDDALTFLGLAAVGDAVDPAAVHQLRQLRNMGVTLILRDDSTQHMDVPVLRRNLDIPDLHARPDIHLCIANPWPDSHTLAIIRHRDRTLDAPIRELREHFASMSFMLARLSGVMGLCLMACILTGGLYSALAVTAVLAAAYLSFGSLISARAIRPHEMLLTGASCLLIRLLMNAVAPAAQDFAGTLLCLTMTALLSLTLSVPGRPLTLRDLAPMLIALSAGVIAVVVRSLPVLATSLLPGLLGIVCGALIGLIFLFTGR